MFELDIEILWHTDETKKLENSGVDVDPSELERKTITFYRVDVISPYKWDDDNMFCKITAGGETWITPYEYEVVRSMIIEAKRRCNTDKYYILYEGIELLFKQYLK